MYSILIENQIPNHPNPIEVINRIIRYIEIAPDPTFS